ncbi:MAG: Gldg family protein [Holophagales bacterium]|nr:Gldg family protein [Holophagales bacterium]
MSRREEDHTHLPSAAAAGEPEAREAPTRRTDAQPPSSRRRAVVEGTTLSAGVIVVLALFAMANYLSMRHYWRADWTSSSLYTLSEKSETLVRDLDRDVDIVVLLSRESELYAAMDELIDRYVAANPERMSRRDLDSARNLLELQQIIDRYGIDRDNVIVVASEGDKRVIGEYELAEFDYSGAQFGQPPALAEFKGEQQITSAILSLMEARKPKVVFTTGHGEAPFEAGGTRPLAQARELLGQDNFELETWSTLGAAAVPEGTDLLVIAGPTSRFLPPELELIGSYLDGGGRLLLFLDPSFGPEGRELQDLGLEEWLRGYGIEVGRDVVLDPELAVPFYGPETFYTTSYGSHPVVEGLEQTGTPVIWTLARSVRAADPEMSGLGADEVVELSSTSVGGWAESTPTDGPVEPSEGELRGPISIAVATTFPASRGEAGDGGIANAEVGDGVIGDGDPALEETTDGPTDGSEPSAGDGAESDTEEAAEEARMVVFGDLDFATDTQLGNAGNGVLLLNTFNWLVEREALIEIEPRKPEKTRLSVNQDELGTIYLMVLFVLPGASLLLGVWIAMRRRR